MLLHTNTLYMSAQPSMPPVLMAVLDYPEQEVVLIVLKTPMHETKSIWCTTVCLAAVRVRIRICMRAASLCNFCLHLDIFATSLMRCMAQGFLRQKVSLLLLTSAE